MADTIHTAPTSTFGQVTGFDNIFIQHEIEDERNSALDHKIFTTVNNDLDNFNGDVYHVNRITTAGVAEDVAEGAGNTAKVSTGVVQLDYEIKTAQDWFQYSDERLRKNPDSVAAGIAHLGVAIVNKTNLEIVAELAKATQAQTSTTLDFDAFVDAQNLIDLDTATQIGQEEGDLSASEQATANQTIMLVGKAQRAAIRKACKDELQYVEAFIRTGYIGTIAGTNIYYSKLMDATNYKNKAFLFTKAAVTTFIKSGVEVESSQKGNRSSDDANTRMNNVFARQKYVVALTDDTKAAVITIGSSS